LEKHHSRNCLSTKKIFGFQFQAWIWILKLRRKKTIKKTVFKS
jgi:hypothetical protein